MANFTGGEKLTAAYIKKTYKKFQAVDQDGSGRIEYPEFLTVMEREDSFLMKRMFDVFDTDKSGTLELKEFIAAYIKKTYKKFQAVDQDGSGRIEYPEFLTVMEREDSFLMKRMFDVFDTDKSGTLELKEFIVR
ncbi:centrin, putative [Perkinsus marinus ATCC 50983]|uniref:Centrin, putative n=1 Tax=Perkinsus marinus (strain ATCC 50983 / TXsc) TaxID=423536 RepID=C5KCN6_PERM5|nr:centrin, putative [Perkinsus marinus ATCC 50983]EER17635.1 centrin, putative [Perkinsus marinus ATCC 50983]|eukprot:XP_002785839.1 centrin, putative [Perkinsus marinus ATCC 50983]